MKEIFYTIKCPKEQSDICYMFCVVKLRVKQSADSGHKQIISQPCKEGMNLVYFVQ